MIKEAIEKVLALAPVQHLEYGGRNYTDRPIVPVLSPLPKELAVHTLTGLEDYLRENPDGLELDNLFLHVESPTSVRLLSSLTGSFQQRRPYLLATHEMPAFKFGQYMDIENFIVELQAKFVPCEMTAKILQLVGTLTDDLIQTYADDGVTQSVTAKTSIGRVAQQEVPNPVTLSPYRTFNEIVQPTGKFILRLKGGVGEGKRPAVALFEADGGSWQLTGILSIRDWLRARVPEKVAVIA